MRPRFEVVLGFVLVLCILWSEGMAGEALVFEENLGQAPESVRFLARQKSIHFTIENAAFTLSAANGDWIRFSFTGACPAAAVRGERALQGTRNYFVGSDRRRWAADVKTWERVTIDDLYPGINLVFRSNGEDLEYDFIVEPGARAEVIAMRAEGTMRLEQIGAALVGATDEGVVFEHHPPRSFQAASPVASSWDLRTCVETRSGSSSAIMTGRRS
jgi:hypothetical protein